MQKKYPKTRKSPRINEKLWPQDTKKEEKKTNPPHNARKEETKQNPRNKYSPNKNVTNVDKEDNLPQSDKRRRQIVIKTTQIIKIKIKIKKLHLMKTLNTKQEVLHPL